MSEAMAHLLLAIAAQARVQQRLRDGLTGEGTDVPRSSTA